MVAWGEGGLGVIVTVLRVYIYFCRAGSWKRSM